MIDIRRVRYFLAVSEELNFSKAARRLHMSQPPLTKQIRTLEESLGVRLFNRTTREVRLTPIGQLLQRRAYELVDAFDEFQMEAKRAAAGEIGNLRIACIASAFYEFMPSLIRAYRDRHPEVTIDILETDSAVAIEELLEGKVDVALIRVDSVAAPLRLRWLKTDELVIALPTGHPLAKHKEISVHELRDFAVVMTRRSISHQYYDGVMRVFVDNDAIPTKVVEKPSLRSQLGLVACGLACAVVPKSSSILRMPGVVFRSLRERSQIIDLSVVWSSLSTNALLSKFLEGVDGLSNGARAFGGFMGNGK